MSFPQRDQCEISRQARAKRDAGTILPHAVPILLSASLAIVLSEIVAGIYGMRGVYYSCALLLALTVACCFGKCRKFRGLVCFVAIASLLSAGLTARSFPSLSVLTALEKEYQTKLHKRGKRARYVYGTFQGRVVGPIERRTVGAVRFIAQGTLNDRFHIRILLSGADVPWSELSHIAGGDELRAAVRFKTLRLPSLPFDLFSYDSYLLRRSVAAQGYISKVRWIVEGSEHRDWRERFYHRLFATFGDLDSLGVLLAATLAERSFVSDAVFRLFKETGTAHLLVVSGYHLAVIYLFGVAISGFVLRRSATCLLYLPIPQLSAVMGLVICGAYCALIGAQLTLIRSLLVIAIYVTGEVVGRKGNGFTNLLLAFIVVALIWPGCFFEASAQLTFSALGGLLFASHLAKTSVLTNSPSKLKKAIASAMLLNFWAWLATAPVVLLWFNGIALEAAFINLCLTAIFSFPAIVCGGLSLCAFQLSLPGSELFIKLVMWMVAALLYALEGLHDMFGFIGLGYYELTVERSRSLAIFIVVIIFVRLCEEARRLLATAVTTGS